MQIKSINKLVIRGVLLSCPFVLLMVLELFILPIDFFTFRIWESLLATPYRYPGVFYPNMHVIKEHEYGDKYRILAPQDNKSKKVEWWTDSYGYRNRPELAKLNKYDAVILGDSNIVGSSLDQKNTLSEVLSDSGNINAYSYSVGSDHISLFFNDPRFIDKDVNTVVIESKSGYWLTNESYLINFKEGKNSELEIVDRSNEFFIYYSMDRNLYIERLYSRIKKMVMLNWAKASLRSEININNTNEKFYKGVSPISNQSYFSGDVFFPNNWIVDGVAIPFDANQQGVSLKIKILGGYGYWKTEKFISSKPNGKIVAKFDARNSIGPSKHRVYIHEDGIHRSLGDFLTSSKWQSYEIPISTNPGSLLEFQIDQSDNWQVLELRNVRIQEAKAIYRDDSENEVLMSLKLWSGIIPNSKILEPKLCTNSSGLDSCRSWKYHGDGKYIQSPIFNIQDKFNGYLVSFRAKSSNPNNVFMPVFAFEGDQYREVGSYLYGREWTSYKFFVYTQATENLKIQLNLPGSSNEIEVSDFKITPTVLIRQ
jgi:hypothetical protein